MLREYHEYGDCPGEMVAESSVIKTKGRGVVGEVAVEKRGLECSVDRRLSDEADM